MLPGSVAELSCFRLSFGNWEILYWVKICWLTKPLWNPQMILTGALRELMEGVFNSKSHDSTLIFAIAILQIHLFQLLLPLMCVRFSTNLTISLCQQLLWFCLSAWSAYKKPFFGTSIWIAYLCQRISYASIRTECVVLNKRGWFRELHQYQRVKIEQKGFLLCC